MVFILYHYHKRYELDQGQDPVGPWRGNLLSLDNNLRTQR